MDSITEKKWFVYLGNRHEGPFSVEEIREKMNEGRVSAENFVWMDGMPDWKVMMEISDFDAMPNNSTQSFHGDEPNIEVGKSLHEGQETEEQTAISKDSSLPSFEEKSQSTAIPHQHSTESQIGLVPINDLHKQSTRSRSRAKRTPKPASYRGLKFLSFAIFLGLLLLAFNQRVFNLIQQIPELRATYNAASTFSRPYLLNLAERIPSLGRWISPLPTLEGVTPDDFEELKAAAKDKVEAGGARFAIALSRTHLSFPTFYLSSNLPDSASFQVYVVGISDTLMNQLSFSTQVEVTLTKKLGITPVIRYADGKPIPRGEYVIYVTPSESQPPHIRSILSTAQVLPTRITAEIPKHSKILAYKTYFLGGERDSTYLSRLKSFHDMLRAKASEELSNLNQYAVTLENQLTSTDSKFELSQRGKITKKQRKNWAKFHKEWIALQNGLNQNIQNWTPEEIQNDYFYGSLFFLAQQAGQAIEKAHGFQNAYFTKTFDLSTFQIQLGEASSTAQSTLALLKSKIDQAEKLTPTPIGMPRREGL